ncbi:MAG: stalk domain-containing protein [Caldisericota bacterium]|nr:stalk domain-containing protein [Caldisericota bacterium]
MKKICVILLLLFLFFAYIPKIFGETLAFNKNFLISNEDFIDFNSMNLVEINNFLFQQGTVLPFYQENGETAAQIIFNAAQKYKINPKVIIATIQKEESLIAATTYNQHALDYAMGYHKPSTFATQVDNGTNLLRYAFDIKASEYGWEVGAPHKTLDNHKYIENVVIPENTATTALYLYTPYIGGYYQDNGVYIGGNYLFFKVYTRWFGMSQKLYSKFSEKNISFYVPEETASTLPIKVFNNGEIMWEKGLSLTTILSPKNIDIISSKLENNIENGEFTTFYIQVPPLINSIKIHMQLLTNNEELFGEIIEIEVIPVKLATTIKIDEENIKISVSNKTVDIPYFTLKEELLDSDGTIIQEKFIMNEEKFIKYHLISETDKTLNNMSSFQVVLKCIGTSQPIELNTDILPVLLTKPYSSGKFLLTIGTTPQGASLCLNNEKTEYITPLSILVAPGLHHIALEKNGFELIENDIEVANDTEISLELTKTDFEPPELLVNKPKLVNSTPILLKGKVLDNTSVESLQINGQAVNFDTEGNFSIDYHLEDGENEIQISCTDTAGNLTEDSFVVTLDRIPPEILSSTTPRVTPNVFIKINLQAIDAINLYVNEKKCDNTEYSDYIKLNIGKNIIEAIAEDEAGNKTVKNIVIAYSPLPPTILQLFIGKKYIYVNSTKKNIDTAPIIKNERTFLPIRAIIESLGGKILYEAENKEVTIFINGAEIHLFIGNNIAIVNEKEVRIDENENVYPLIINSRTYLPLRFIIENIVGSVEWDAKERKVTITYPLI